MGGISRVNSRIIAPKNFAGVGLSDFTLQVNADAATNVWSKAQGDLSTANGALDQIFRNATGNVGTVSRIGTITTASTNFTLRFAVETLGVDSDSPGTLGGGVFGNSTAATTATAAALAGAIQSLGTVNSINLSTATVTAFTY